MSHTYAILTEGGTGIKGPYDILEVQAVREAVGSITVLTIDTLKRMPRIPRKYAGPLYCIVLRASPGGTICDVHGPVSDKAALEGIRSQLNTSMRVRVDVVEMAK